MTGFQKWQMDLMAQAAASVTTTDNSPKPLCAEDQAVHDLCLQFSETDLLATPAAEEPIKSAAVQSAVTPGTRLLSFKRSVVSPDSVEEAYQQLIGIGQELVLELAIRHWDESRNFVETHIDHLRVAHDSGQLAGLASSVAKALGRFKSGCETFAGYAVKTKSAVADVGELFLLTALSAHELRRALSEVFDC